MRDCQKKRKKNVKNEKRPKTISEMLTWNKCVPSACVNTFDPNDVLPKINYYTLLERMVNVNSLVFE